MIINGKKYDTETAKELANDSFLYPGDFRYWSETLYQKRNGEYFLHGEGGPLSQYARFVGMTARTNGEKIIPFTIEEAMQWAEKHLEGNEFEKIFGEVEE